MGRVSPIKRYKAKLLSSITNSPELIKLVDDKYVIDGECIGADEELVYKKIFPFYYIPDAQTTAASYVIMKVNGLGVKKNIYSRVEVYICVISHQDIMQVKDGDGTRIDMMSEIIEELFDGRDDFGFGEMELLSNLEENVNTTHRCRVLRFVIEDFNSDACQQL